MAVADAGSGGGGGVELPGPPLPAMICGASGAFGGKNAGRGGGAVMAGPLGMGGAATACFQRRGGGAGWKSLSFSLRIFLGRKWPSLALRRFSYFRSSTSVIMTTLTRSRIPRTSPRPIKDPFHHISSWNVWNFMPYCKTMKMDAKVNVLDAKYGMMVMVS